MGRAQLVGFSLLVSTRFSHVSEVVWQGTKRDGCPHSAWWRLVASTASPHAWCLVVVVGWTLSPCCLSSSRRLAWASDLSSQRESVEAERPLQPQAHKLPHVRSALFVGQSNSRGQAQIQGLFLMRGAARSHCRGTQTAAVSVKSLRVSEWTGEKRSSERE